MRTFDIERRLSYRAAFYARAMHALMRGHRLRAGAPSHYRAGFSLGEAQVAAWAETFGVEAAERLPFTYGNISATMILLQILADRGINLRHVRHLRCDLVLPTQPYAAAEGFTLATDVRPPVALRADRIALITDTDTLDSRGECVARQTDVWCILNVPPADVARATQPSGSFIEALRGLTRLTPEIASGERLRLDVPPDMGVRYGWVSGDLNPTHLSHRAARLFGSPKAFVQGFCTINLLIAATRRLGLQPQTLSTTLARPVFVGQTIELRAKARNLELCDAQGALLAIARWAAEGE